MDQPDVYIRSVATALPGQPVDNARLAERFGMDELWQQWVDGFIGTRTRYLATDLDTGKAECSLADLGAEAGALALERAAVGPGDIDLIVMATATPDHLMPATVNLVADRLGIDGVPSFQLQSGCSGAVQALDVARQLIRGGRHRTALVLGGDVGAKHHDLDTDLRSLTPAELVNVVLFGDGAGAVVLAAEPGPAPVLIREAFVRLVGLGRAPGQVIEWFGLADRGSAASAGAEDYKAIEERVPVMAGTILTELADRLGWSDSGVDYVLPPQLSGRMTARIVKGLDLAARHVSCVEEIGNNGNGLVFFQLERLLPRMAPGERALAAAVESSKWIESGFALERV